MGEKKGISAGLVIQSTDRKNQSNRRVRTPCLKQKQKVSRGRGGSRTKNELEKEGELFQNSPFLRAPEPCLKSSQALSKNTLRPRRALEDMNRNSLR